MRLLGPLRTTWSGRDVSPPSGMDLAFLGELLVHAENGASTAHLVEALWPGRPPARPVNAVQVRICRLRRVDPAAADAIRTSAQGCRPVGCPRWPAPGRAR